MQEPLFGIEVVHFYSNDNIKGINKSIPIPAIVKTKQFFRIKKQNIKFSRKNIFLRDNNICQYCGLKFHSNNLTYDHIIPKSKWNYNDGSPTVWTNITTSCLQCNRKKGDKTPKEANMPLRSLPYQPQENSRYLPISYKLLNIKHQIPDEWKLYIPPSYITQ
jgi:5-methylcytosine-specific restriction endonuclease McrA